MNRIKTTLLKIVGRIKENMSTISITVAMTFLAVGFAMLVWAVDKAEVFYRDIASALIFLGIFSWLITLELFRREQKREDKIRDTLLATMESIKDEIKGLRSDLGGKKRD